MTRRCCKECGRPILLVKNANTGNFQPVDPTPQLNAGGNIALIGQGEDVQAIVLSKADLTDGRPRWRYFAHQATCPKRVRAHAPDSQPVATHA